MVHHTPSIFLFKKGSTDPFEYYGGFNVHELDEFLKEHNLWKIQYYIKKYKINILEISTENIFRFF